MEIEKESVLKLIREQGGPERADQAKSALPDRIDTDRDAALLQQFGVDPQDLTSGIPGRGDDLSRI